MSGDATWVGTLRGVELDDGTYVELAPIAVGVLPGIGLVTAADRASLETGRYITPAAGRYQRVRALYYRRRRLGQNSGLNWRHELKNTAFARSPRGPVFVSLSRAAAARVCPSPPGDFICEG